MLFRAGRWSIYIAVVLAWIAMIAYSGGTPGEPDAVGYTFFENSLSDLGAKVAWNGQPNPVASRLYTSAGILFAFACGLCFFGFFRIYSSSQKGRSLIWAAACLLAISVVGLVGLSLYAVDRTPDLHGRFTLLAIAPFPIATALLTAATGLDRRNRWRVPLGWLALTIVTATWFFSTQVEFRTGSSLNIAATLQKITAAVFVAIIVFQSHEAKNLRKNGAGRS